jgi:hypothetical protein
MAVEQLRKREGREEEETRREEKRREEGNKERRKKRPSKHTAEQKKFLWGWCKTDMI